MTNDSTPLANPNGPPPPAGTVEQQAPPPPIPQASPTQGAAQTAPAPQAKRNRLPRGPISQSSSSGSSGAPALLELSAAYPMFTIQRRPVNAFVPDSQMLFHVLGHCDQLMSSTDRFLRSSPAWLPIVSQLYISVLWMVFILRVFVTSGYGSFLANDFRMQMDFLQIGECMVPGPLVPFFQALAAVNGPFEWLGDITPALPDFANFWNAAGFYAHESYARTVPIPAIILDQLCHFSRYPIPANQASSYSTFEWYHNVFNITLANQNRLHRIGPQLCGSLFTTQNQFDAARNFWNSCLHDFTRVDAAAAGALPFTDILGLLGLKNQAGNTDIGWFIQATIVMQKYSQYFNGSIPLKSLLPTGIGAVVTVGTPTNNDEVRNFLYPTNAMVEPFTSTRFNPRREIPPTLKVTFEHSDHEIEEQAEQYAIATHTNVDWSTIPVQNGLLPIQRIHNYQGDYWTMMKHRSSSPIMIKAQYAQIIASRYHQQAANRAE